MQPKSKLEHQRELSSIRKRLQKVRKEISKLKTEEKGVLKEIRLLEEQVRLTRRLVGELRNSQRVVLHEIDSLEISIDSLEAEMEGSKENLRKRLVSLYKRGQFYNLEVMFGASSAVEVYDRLYFTRYAARAEEKMFNQLLDTKSMLEEREDSLSLYNRELAKLLSEKRDAQDSLTSAKRRNQKKLSDIKKSKKSKEKLVKELDARRKRLTKLIASLDKKGSTSPNRKVTGTVIEKGRGNMPWPVSSRKLIASYGTIVHPRYKTKTFNDGIDIDCSGGRSVKSIARGLVKVAGEFSGYGLLVIVDHQDGYYSIYSNLDKITVSTNTKVSRGQKLGKASDYLHFSISKRAKFMNPINYLK